MPEPDEIEELRKDLAVTKAVLEMVKDFQRITLEQLAEQIEENKQLKELLSARTS